MSLLHFQREILRDAVVSDGLWVLANGLGVLQVVSALIKQYEKEKQLIVVCQEHPLLQHQVLNATPQDLGPIAERKYSLIQHDLPCKDRFLPHICPHNPGKPDI